MDCKATQKQLMVAYTRGEYIVQNDGIYKPFYNTKTGFYAYMIHKGNPLVNRGTVMVMNSAYITNLIGCRLD